MAAGDFPLAAGDFPFAEDEAFRRLAPLAATSPPPKEAGDEAGGGLASRWVWPLVRIAGEAAGPLFLAVFGGDWRGRGRGEAEVAAGRR